MAGYTTDARQGGGTMTNYASQGGGAMTLYESNAMPLLNAQHSLGAAPYAAGGALPPLVDNAQHLLGAAPYAAGGGLMSLYMGGADGAMTNYSAGGAVADHNYVTNYTMSAQAMAGNNLLDALDLDAVRAKKPSRTVATRGNNYQPRTLGTVEEGYTRDNDARANMSRVAIQSRDTKIEDRSYHMLAENREGTKHEKLRHLPTDVHLLMEDTSVNEVRRGSHNGDLAVEIHCSTTQMGKLRGKLAGKDSIQISWCELKRYGFEEVAKNSRGEPIFRKFHHSEFNGDIESVKKINITSERKKKNLDTRKKNRQKKKAAEVALKKKKMKVAKTEESDSDEEFVM